MQEKDKANKQGKTNKTIRFPRAVAEEVTEQIEQTGGTFSAFVIAAVRKALEKEKGNSEASAGKRQ